MVSMQLLAFEDMGVRVEELMQYAAAEEEVPFAHPVTKFPVSKKPTLPPTFADKKEVCCACHERSECSKSGGWQLLLL